MYSGLGWVMGVMIEKKGEIIAGIARLPENSAGGVCGISNSPKTQAHHHCARRALLRLTFTNKRIFYKSISNDGY